MAGDDDKAPLNGDEDLEYRARPQQQHSNSGEQQVPPFDFTITYESDLVYHRDYLLDRLN